MFDPVGKICVDCLLWHFPDCISNTVHETFWSCVTHFHSCIWITFRICRISSQQQQSLAVAARQAAVWLDQAPAQIALRYIVEEGAKSGTCTKLAHVARY